MRPSLFLRAWLCLALLSYVLSATPPATATVPIMHVSDIRPGMRGYGRTVFKGTQVVSFPITVLGVVKNYIADSDLVLIRVTGGYPAQHGIGIIAGMSGSPVYVNGKLVGAIAYGWPFAKEPIGGVTPIESMLAELPGGRKTAERSSLAGAPHTLTTPIQVQGRTLRRVQVLPTARAAQGASADTLVLTPVPSLLQVHGFGSRAFAGIEKLLRPLNMEPIQTFAAGGPVPRMAPPLEPGSAVGVQLLTGDLDISGTGTLTYLDGNRFLAFGHPLAQLGQVSLPMTAAYIQDILPSYSRSFKFASQIAPIGELSWDRLWAVGGILGRKVPMVPLRINVDDRSRGYHKTYHLRAIQHPILGPSIVTQAVVEALSTAVSTGSDATAMVHLKIKPHGHAAIDIDQMWSGANVDASLALQFSDMMENLATNDFSPLTFDDVSVDVRLEDGKRTAVIEQLYTSRRSYRPGEDVDVHVVLKPYGQKVVEKVVTIPLPAELTKGPVMIGVAGGGDITTLRKRLAQPKPEPTNLEQFLRLLEEQERNQQIVVRAAFPTHAAVVGEERFQFLPESLRDILPELPQSNIGAERDYSERRLDTGWVIKGAEVLQTALEVRIDSEKKADTFVADLPRAERQSASGALLTRPATEVTPPRSAAAATDKTTPVGTRHWDLSDFDRGDFTGTCLSERGDVSLAPRLDTVASLGEHFLWSLAQDPSDSSLVVGSAQRGRAFRISLHGKEPPQSMSVRDAAVSAVAVAADHSVWLGTAPHGQVYRKAGQDEAQLLYSGKEMYVWSILPRADGSALVATGNPALLLQVYPSGRSHVLHRFSQRHIRSLVAGAGSDVYIACASPGAVYKMTGDAEPQLLFESDYGSVDAIVAGADGALDAASGKNLYRMRAGARLRVVPVDDKPLLALVPGGNGTVVASGANGHIYRIDANDAVSRIGDLRGGPVTALLALPSGEIVGATGGPGSVIRLGESNGGDGLWTSDVLDAGSAAQWGRVRWMAGGAVTLQTRSGHTAYPDQSWSPWSSEYTTASGQTVSSPAGRYLQVRALLRGGGESPTLSAVAVFFKNESHAPAVELTYPSGGERVSGAVKLQWKVSSGLDVAAFDVAVTADGGKTWKNVQKGVAPNAKDGSPSPAQELSWSSRGVSDGTYQLRIEAYDPASPQARSRALSKPFVVTNTTPNISILSRQSLPSEGGYRVKGIAKSHLAWITSVLYRQGKSSDWKMAAAEDGVYDSDHETFTLIVPSGEEVEIKATDEAGNTSTLKSGVK